MRYGGVEDNLLQNQALITTTNAPSFMGSFQSASSQSAGAWVRRNDIAITSDYDDFGVYHVAPAVSGSFYRITIHGAGATRNFIIERWRMTSVNVNSKVNLGY